MVINGNKNHFPTNAHIYDNKSFQSKIDLRYGQFQAAAASQLEGSKQLIKVTELRLLTCSYHFSLGRKVDLSYLSAL